MDFSVVEYYLGFLTNGLIMTAKLTALAVAGGTAGGTVLALGRLMHNSLPRHASTIIVESIRGTPILMIIFWFYFLIPRVIGHSVGSNLAGILALITFNSAYTAEIVRAGIQSVPVGEIEAATSTGLNWWHRFRYIVLPQAFEKMTPALISQVVMVYKTTSLVYVIGVIDFFGAATIVNNQAFHPYEIYAFVAFVYLIPSTIGSHVSRVLGRRRARARV